jgi:hypothetical protein
VEGVVVLEPAIAISLSIFSGLESMGVLTGTILCHTIVETIAIAAMARNTTRTVSRPLLRVKRRLPFKGVRIKVL